jgi:hypothetical protein
MELVARTTAPTITGHRIAVGMHLVVASVGDPSTPFCVQVERIGEDGWTGPIDWYPEGFWAEDAAHPGERVTVPGLRFILDHHPAEEHEEYMQNTDLHGWQGSQDPGAPPGTRMPGRERD